MKKPGGDRQGHPAHRSVHIEVKSPAMTGQWEAHLKRIQRGAEPLEPFLEGIEN